MQTFLPYPPTLDTETGFYDFENSARVLDNKRLGKQRVEGYQILSILCGKTARWVNHPAVLQWKGFEWTLYDYVCNMCMVWKEKGFKDTIGIKVDALDIKSDVSDRSLPPWMGRADFHASHRSRLLFKGRVDAAILALKTRYLPRGYSVKAFLEKAALPKQNVFTNQDIQTLEEVLKANGVIIEQNHYAQFGWTEPDNIPYIWPVVKADLKDKHFQEKVSALVEKYRDKIKELQ